MAGGQDQRVPAYAREASTDAWFKSCCFGVELAPDDQRNLRELEAEIESMSVVVDTVGGLSLGPQPSPGTSGRANLRIRMLIEYEIRGGHVVEIYALTDRALHHNGSFHLNLAAGLEDSIIAVVAPVWNGGRATRLDDREEPQGDVESPEAFEVVGAPFSFVAHPTCRNMGFFNVPTTESGRFGGDGQRIELFLGAAVEPVTGTINRTAAKNGTPRIMGGTRVRDWLQAHVAEGAACRVEMLSPVSIRLVPEGSGAT